MQVQPSHKGEGPSQPFVCWEADAIQLRCRSVGGELETLGFPLERWRTEPHFLLRTLFASDRERFLGRCRAAEAGSPSIERYRVHTADGQVRPFQVALRAGRAKRSLWLRGEMVGMAPPEPWVARSLLEAPHTRGALGTIAARFDAQLRHLYVSPCIERIVGFPARAFIGRTNEELGMPPALVRAWREAMLRTFRRGEPQELEFNFLMPAGKAPARLARLQSVLTPEFDERGDVRSVCSHAEVFLASRPGARTPRSPLATAAPPAETATPGRRAGGMSAEECFEWLSQASQALASLTTEAELYRAIERVALPLLGDWGGIAMLQGQQLEHVALLSRTPAEAHGGPWARPFPFATRVILAGRAQLLSGSPQHVLESLALDGEHQRQLREAGLLDFMAAPLFRQGVCRGCLWFASTEAPRGRLGMRELRLAEQLALFVSPALEAVRLRKAEEELHQRELWLRQKLEGLRRVGAALGEALLPTQVADAVMGEVKAALGAWAAVVYRTDADGSALEMLRASGYSADATRGFERLPLAFITPITDAVRGRVGVWVESAEAFRRAYPELAARVPPKPGARVALPLLIEGRALGVLAMSFEADRQFGPEERAFGLALAQLCAQALERVGLYQQLHGRLEEFRTLLDVLPVGIRIARDRDGKRIEQNLAFEQLAGVPASEVRFFQQGRLLKPEEHPLRRAAASGKPVLDVELEVQLPEGPRRTVLGSAAPLFDSGHRPRGAVGAYLDITERKHAAEAQRFLADSGPLLSASLEPEQTFHALTHLCVPTLSRLAVLYAQEGQGAQRVSCAHVHPELEPLTARLGDTLKLFEQPALQRVLRRRKSLTVDVWRAAGKARHEGRALRELLDQLGVRGLLLLPLVASKRMVGLLVLGLETSGCAREVRTLARAFALRAALAMDNVRLYQEARHAISLRDEFLSVAGHELRTPLTALQLGLRNLARASKAGDAAKLEKWAAQCQSQGVRLGRLVDGLLDVGRITAGRLPLVFEEVELTALVQECVTRMASAFEEAGCAISVHAPGPITGTWDSLRLEQVVTNLLSNAVKYGQGKPVRVSLFATREVAVVSVEDQGIGIAPQDQARIFQRFERAVSERHYWGMGLGLWIAQELVSRLGGRIELRSVPGQGSAFTVYLPRVRPEAAS